MNSSGTSAISGNLNVSAGANLNFNGGTYNFTAGSTLTCAGNVTISSGAVNFNGTYSFSGNTVNMNGGTANFGNGGSVSAQNINVTNGTANFSNNGLINLQTLQVTGGTANLNTPATAVTVTLSSDRIGGSGILTATSVFTWTGGPMGGSGSTKIPTGASLNITGTGIKYLDTRAINNAGTTTWTGTGDIYVYNGAAINNTGLFDAQNNEYLYYNGGAAVNFNNNGTFRKSVFTATTTIALPFNNYRTVDVTTGALSLTGNGTSSGIFNVPSGSLALFSSNNYSLNTGANFIGSGLVRATGGVVAVNGTARVRNLELTSGTINGAGNLSVLDSFNWTGGTMSGSGSTSILATAVMTITGAANKFLDIRTLNNAGAVTWTDTGDLYLSSGAAFNNSGSFDTRNDRNFYYYFGNPPSLVNSGILTKSFAGPGSASSYISTILTNTGTINVLTGTLNLGGGGSSSGATNVSAGATLNFSNGTYNFLTGSVTTGAGTLNYSGGVVNFAGAYNVSGLTNIAGGTANFNGTGTTASAAMSGGVLGGIGTLTATNVFTWTGGSMNGVGSTNIAASASLNMTGTSKFLDIRTLNNAGAATWAGLGDIYLSNGAVFNNSGIFDTQNDRSLYYYLGSAVPVFNNSGVFRKSAGAATTSVSILFTNVGTVSMLTGAINFSNGYTQSAGTTNLNDGNISGNTLNIQGGSLTGVGTIGASVINSGGQVSPGSSPGILTITGNYTQSPSGALNIEIGGPNAGTDYDRLNVVGNATLAGALNISVTNGFAPNIGNVFQVMNYNFVTGGFATVTGADMGNGLYFVPGYNPTNLTLTVSAIPATATPTATVTPTGTQTSTPTATPPACGPGANYPIVTATATIDAGSADIGNHCDDCVTTIALPFPVQLYGTPFTSVTASSNGNLQFNSGDSSFSNICLPYSGFNNVILAYWDDLRTDVAGSGIFTSVVGAAPNRVFNVEWRTVYFNNGGQGANFEARLHENQDRFELIYGIVDQGGNVATIGVQRGTGSQYTQYECNTAGAVTSGLQLTFQAPNCGTGTPTATAAPPTTTFTSTATAIASATNTATSTLPTATPTPTSTLTATGASPTVTFTPLATFTRTFTPTVTGTPSTVTPTPINTATGTSTSTATPASGAVFVGHVTWQGRSTQPNALQQLPITLTLKSGATEVNYPTQTTDANGSFTVSVSGLPTGAYSWRVKGPKYLANAGVVQLQVGSLKVEGLKAGASGLQPSTLNVQPSTSVEIGLMRAGDCNNDNQVNVVDFNILKLTFGKGVGDPGYDDRADFTGDGIVNVNDFNLLKGAFGLGGAPPI